jgi:hypothetical protein
MPAVLKAPAPLAVEQWKYVFDTGHAIGPALAIISSGCFAYVAYNRTSLCLKLSPSPHSLSPPTFKRTLLIQ